MIHLKVRLFLNPQLSVFFFGVLHHVVSLLLLTVASTSQTIVGLVGEDITLPCQLETATDASAQTVEWARHDLDPRFVYLKRDGVELLIEQHPSYVGRASLFATNMKCGDVSLKLSKAKLSDTGTYRCLVPTFNKDSAVELVVGSVSSPDIQFSVASSGVVLQCESKGWYPEPEVLWLDSEGNLLSAGPTETVRGPDDLYTVSSRVTVEKRHINSFTCRVQQRNINQTRETHIHITDDFFMDQSSSSVRIISSLVVCFMCVLIVVLVVWKIKKTKSHQDNSELEEKQKTTFSNSTELQFLIEEERDRKHPMTESEKIKYLDTTKAKLDDELQRNEREMKHVKQVIITLTRQKVDLKNQRGKLTSLMQEVKSQIQENKKKLEKLEKSAAAIFDKVVEREAKQKQEKVKLELESRMKVLGELIKNTDKLLETTEGMINTMTEKKGKLETDKEQINKHLKETKRHKDELQRKLQPEQGEREEEQHKPINDSA